MSVFLKGKKVSGLVGWARLVATQNTAKLKKNGIDCTNVEDSLYALSNSLNNLNNRFAVINANSGSITSPILIRYDYPEGFNFNNCVILSTMYKIADDVWVQHSSLIYGQLREDNVCLYSEGVVTNTDAKIVLMRIS